MNRPLAFSLLALLCGACSSGNSGTGSSSGSGSSSGGSSSGDGGLYTIIPIDPNASAETMFNMAISPTGQIGVAYFYQAPDGGVGANQSPNIDVRYAEVSGTTNAITVPSTYVTTALLTYGVTVAFDPTTNLPAIGHLGGADYGGTPINNMLGVPGDAGPPVTGSTYWINSQAELDYEQSDGTWTRDICMESSTGASCQEPSCPAGSPGMDNGFDPVIDYPPGTVDTSAEQLTNNPFGEIVGLWPSLLFDGGTALMAFRDIHEGQFPIQDYGAADTKMCMGGPGGSSFSWSAPLTLGQNGDNQHNDFGVHNQMIFGPNGLLAVVADISTAPGQEDTAQGPVWFTMQTGSFTPGGSNADWTPPVDPFPSQTLSLINNPGSGASMIYSPMIPGFAIAAVDTNPSGTFAGSPQLYYNTSADGVNWSPNSILTVAGPGSQGFFPTLNIDPVTGNPVVSYVKCSEEPSQTPENGCSPTEAGIEVAELTLDGEWDATEVMQGQFWHPRFGYLPNNKQVFVYSDAKNGGLYVAIQN